MAEQSQLQKDNEDNVPYTVFENAGKGKSGKKMDPSNPDMVANDRSPVQFSSEGKAELDVVNGPETERSRHKRHMSQEDGELTLVQTTDIESSHQHHGGVTSETNESESEANKDLDGTGPSHQRRLSGEDRDIRKPHNSPLRHDTIGKKGNADSPRHHLGGGSTDSPKRVSGQNLRPNRSVEQSPLHPHHQTRTGNKGSGVSSPSWERKGSSEGTHSLAPFTPGRSRLRSSVTGGDETPDHGPVVPKFGDWDESDPSAGEGFTHIFNKVQEEKQSETGKVPIVPTETSYSSNGQKQSANDSSKGCFCFPWGRK
ncbi:RPM1-interacting protein 4-like [Heracleum sosnowskyi]|uniref:RPM1-interacting protein 4-like n=1 Tax=Heracleum sosnowskyi TaxID=360622 RepID=A0AAD8I8K5_9APIA|nr:RPM1-interacting protein 4-like [Heracleum sosnowskyi]